MTAFLLKHWHTIAAAVALIALGAFAANLIADKRVLATEIAAQQIVIAQQKTRADEMARAALALSRAVARMDEAARAQAETRRQLQSFSSKVTRSIDESPPQDDGPIAPVLARTLEQLREQERERAGGLGDPARHDGSALAAPVPAVRY